MNFTPRAYLTLSKLKLTGKDIDALIQVRASRGGNYTPSSEAAYQARLELFETTEDAEGVINLLSKLPFQDEALIDEYVQFLMELKSSSPKFSYGQLLSSFLSSKLKAMKLTVVQNNVIANINGSHNEPEYPADVLAEILDMLTKPDPQEEMIRTLKALPKPAERVVLPDGVTAEMLQDRDYRLNSGMYKIVSKVGKLIPFHMTENQKLVYEDWKLNPLLVIDKSRQLGISTMFLVIATDMCLFTPYQSAGLVSQDMKSASTLFKKVDVILDNLPDYVYSYLNLVADTNNQSELRFNNGSVLFLSSSFRSTTLQLLHVSEVSSIGQANPAKIEELKTGSMQTISMDGTNSIILESTAKSGTDYFADTYNKAKNGLSRFKAIFLSWVNDTTAVLDYCPLPINEKYFEEILPELIADGVVDEGFEFTQEQKNFYTMKLDELGEAKIGQEFPTVDRESFEAHFTGAILGKQLIKHKANQVYDIDYDPKSPLYASFDLGQADYTVICFFQVYKLRGVNIIHCIADKDEPISYYLDKMQEYMKVIRCNRLKTVFIPHDSVQRHSSSSKTVKKQVSEVFTVSLLNRAKNLEEDIQVVKDMIPYVYFNLNSRGVQLLLTNLRSYSWKFTAGDFTGTPDHRSGSDFADSFRYCIMSKVVNSKQSMARWKKLSQKLSEDDEKERALREADGETVIVIGEHLITGDKNFARTNYKDAEDFVEELEYNKRNSTICATDEDLVVDGIAMGYSGTPKKNGKSYKYGNKTVVDGLAL